MTATRTARRSLLVASALLLLVAALAGDSVQAATEQQQQHALVDNKGLAFSSAEAFCAYHCKRTHVANVYAARRVSESQCDLQMCRETVDPVVRRRLTAAASVNGSEGASQEDDDNAVESINFLSCQSVAQSATTLAFEMSSKEELRGVFSDFHDAFFAAFDAMVTSENATYDACQLEFLQQKFLPTVDEKTSVESVTSSFTNSVTNSQVVADEAMKPMLIKLNSTTSDQRQCIEKIKTIWTNEDESVTPFISRADQSASSSTIMLVHVNTSIAERINALECIESVLELPAILKLMPFARSASQLSMQALTEAPALEVRLVKGTDQQKAFTRLQTNFKNLNGIENVFELPGESEHRPRSVYTKALDELETWSHAVALTLTDSEVEWVDMKTSVTQFTIQGSVYGKAMGMGTQHRRLDDYAQSLVGVDAAKAQGISGNNVIVGITDSGLYIDHDQFDQTSRSMYNAVDTSARKVIFYNAWADKYDESADITCGHGTHVAGILAGSSFSGKNKNFGIADSAKIAFMDIGGQSSTCLGQSGCVVSLATPADASDLLKSQIDVGAKIFSFSWGTPGSDYSSQARDLDAFIYSNPEILVIIAAGNSGENSASGQGTISSPSGAKNVISVGASLNDAASFKDYPCPDIFNQYSVASFSSAGPTSDGRMKPDVVAPGMIITSSKSEKPGSTVKSSDTCDLQGTSQATPVVTGLAVLLYEWLRDGWWKNGVKNADYGMTRIPAALLKALIIHSGDSLKKRLAAFESGAISCAGIERKAWAVTYPDMYQGYGKPNMTNIAEFGSTGGAPTLYFLPNSTEGSEPSVAHEKEVKISFTVPRGVDLRATLVWTDPAGSVRAATMLQHDLDLTVQIRNGSKKFAPLTASNTTSRDEKNNVEMVQVSYDQLLAAAKSDANSASLIGTDGEIIVEAVIYGRSVLSAKTQAFAFVASSSGIGSTVGAALSDDAATTTSSIWTPWTIGAIAVGALVLLLLIALIVRCRARRSRRSPTTGGAHGYPAGAAATAGGAPVLLSQGGESHGQQYYTHTTPAGGLHHTVGGVQVRQGGCPYCPFASPDPVVMVNHVENMHGGGGPVPMMDGQFGMPVLSASPAPPSQFLPPPGRQSAHQQQFTRHIPEHERCPYCNFTSPDAVILVNHVEHIHGQ
ncbi:Serine protease [Globisporangium polare]